MILVGNRRGGAAELARHLMNVRDNDHVHIHELRGFVADDLHGALHEAFGISRGTRCKKFLYSLSLSPPETENVSAEIFEAAIEQVEKKLGFAGQPRTVVFHEKNGRRHAHCVWSRIDAATMTAIDPYQDKLTLESIARDLFLTHGWQMPPGFKRRQDTDPLNYSQAEAGQAKRAGHDPKELKRIFAQCWQASDSKAAFAHALKEQSLILARGDRRSFVAVDAGGEVYSISRWVGVKAKEVRARLGNSDGLPSVEEALREFGSVDINAKFNDVSVQRQPSSAHQIKLEQLEQQRLSLVAGQRATRIDLERKHEARQILETTARSAKIPVGLKAAWLKLSGHYQTILGGIEADAARCAARDRAEFQALIENQLKERRTLGREIDVLCQQINDQGNQPDIAARQLKNDPAQALVIPPDPEALSIKDKVQRDPTYILDVITDKKEDFSRPDILRALAKYIDNPLKLGTAVDQIMHCSELVEIQSAPLPRYSTRGMLALKAELSDRVEKLANAKGLNVHPRHASAAIAAQNENLQSAFGASLSKQQEDAIRHCLGPERIAAVVGLAGAGKSTMLSAVKGAYERQGLRVTGAALSGKAADGLESASGIESRTLASLERSWKQGYCLLTKNDVLVIDEAGMIGTRQLNRFVEAAQRAGAKVILVGDPEQLQPINAGTPFRDIVAQITAAHLDEIHRQTQDWQKQASLDLAQQRTGKALDTYEAHGKVKQAKDNDEAIVNLVEDYMVDLNLNCDDISRLALAHRRKDVHAINHAIRCARKTGGDLQDGVLIQTDHGKREFATGDRILFTQNDHMLGLRNGMLGTVQSISENQLTIQLDGTAGAKTPSTLTISPKQCTAIDHGYATTIHKSQGVTVDNTYILGSLTMDRHVTYVAMTRHKREAKLYTGQYSLRNMKRNDYGATPIKFCHDKGNYRYFGLSRN